MGECKTFKVLSIDGGGIRGIIPAMILREIENKMCRPIHCIFDLIAGTSTGGIIALALTAPDCNGNPRYSACSLIDLYREDGSNIFHRDFNHTFNSAGGWLGPKYPAIGNSSKTGIKNVLKKYFGCTTLSETLTDVLIPSYDMRGTRLYYKERYNKRKGGHPRFFKSRNAKKCNLPEENYCMWEVAYATAAAPTFFAPVNTDFTPSSNDKLDAKLTETLLDGGIFANNPAMCAYAEARKYLKEKCRNKDNILLVSLGTGNLTNILYADDAEYWGKVDWVMPLLKNIIFDGASDTVDYQLKQLLDENMYYRLQPDLPEDCDQMDDTSQKNLDKLQCVANSFIKNKKCLLEKVTNSLCKC